MVHRDVVAANAVFTLPTRNVLPLIKGLLSRHRSDSVRINVAEYARVRVFANSDGYVLCLGAALLCGPVCVAHIGVAPPNGLLNPHSVHDAVNKHHHHTNNNNSNQRQCVDFATAPIPPKCLASSSRVPMRRNAKRKI